MSDSSFLPDYRARVAGQIESLTEALTRVMFGDFTAVAQTREPDEAFGYLCVMINVAINAARNAHDDLRLANEKLAGTNERLRATIAEQKLADEEVRRLNENLELLVDQRTAELLEARHAAEQASRAKSEFLSSMSHELRTPLNSILGFAQLLQLDGLVAGHAENVEYILRAGSHLLELIDELLDVARIEEGRIALSIEPVRVEDVVLGALELVEPLAAPGDIRIWAERSRLREHALADQQRLKQVVMNLLANAVKYNRRGGSVSVSCRLTPAGRIRIEVTDTGPGIAPDMMERLFLPFERLGAERTTIQGTGIGLSISKRLVELMGGTIGAESEVGRGSTFWVELEAARLEADGEAVETAASENLAPAPVEAGGGPTILYVEDNLSNLRLVERILERRPAVRLVVAMQGELALDLAREHQPDLVLLDVHLSDIDGDEVLRRLRADPRTRAIPVVAVSAEATPAKIDRFLAAGAQAYLTKPLDVRQLLELVDAIPPP